VRFRVPPLYQDPDATGHAPGWSSEPVSATAATLKAVDPQIGKNLPATTSRPIRKTIRSETSRRFALRGPNSWCHGWKLRVAWDRLVFRP